MSDRRIYFNGIHAPTGEYLEPPMSVHELAGRIAATPRPRSRGPAPQARGLMEGLDQTDLAEAGWGIVFAHDVDPAVREALQPLIDHRKAQATAVDERRFCVFEGENAYRPGDDKLGFLDRYEVGPGPVEPHKVPFYLLLVGDPTAIPFSFQSQMDVPYAVGRIAFDTPEDYARYAASVVAAETGQAPPAWSRTASFAGIRNPGDGATERSCRDLVTPLAENLAPIAERLGWSVEALLAEEATKARVTERLTTAGGPGIVFTAGHGASYKSGASEQRARQGALACQDWPGPGVRMSPEHTVAAEDIASDADCAGRIAFFFACHGGGTPHQDGFSFRGDQPSAPPRVRAPQPFVARLPQRLLAHPKGGALAVAAHVDRAWTFSFDWGPAGPQTQVFETALRRLMGGQPAGWALYPFGERSAEIAFDLTELEDRARRGEELDESLLVYYWTARNDGAGYALLGDPAVRLDAATPGDDDA